MAAQSLVPSSTADSSISPNSTVILQNIHSQETHPNCSQVVGVRKRWLPLKLIEWQLLTYSVWEVTEVSVLKSLCVGLGPWNNQDVAWETCILYLQQLSTLFPIPPFCKYKSWDAASEGPQAWASSPSVGELGWISGSPQAQLYMM